MRNHLRILGDSIRRFKDLGDNIGIFQNPSQDLPTAFYRNMDTRALDVLFDLTGEPTRGVFN